MELSSFDVIHLLFSLSFQHYFISPSLHPSRPPFPSTYTLSLLPPSLSNYHPSIYLLLAFLPPSLPPSVPPSVPSSISPQPTFVSSSYTLYVRANSYSNSYNTVADGTCCNQFATSSCNYWLCLNCQCNNYFTFCLRAYGASHDGNATLCPLGSYKTGDIGDDSFSFGSSSIDSGVPNPLVFTGNVWPVSRSYDSHVMRIVLLRIRSCN